MPVIVSVSEADAWERFKELNSHSLTHIRDIKNSLSTSFIISDIVDAEAIVSLSKSLSIIIVYEPLPILVDKFAGTDELQIKMDAWADSLRKVLEDERLKNIRFLPLYELPEYSNQQELPSVNFLKYDPIPATEKVLVEKLIQASSFHLSIHQLVERNISHTYSLSRLSFDELNKELLKIKELGKQIKYQNWELDELTFLVEAITKQKNEEKTILVGKLLYVQERYEELYLSFHNKDDSKNAASVKGRSDQRTQGWRIDKIINTKLSELRKFRGDVRLIKCSKYFDAEWYLVQNPDVAKAGKDPAEHYIMFGAKEGRNPSELFNGNKYLKLHPDVKAAQLNPLVHYLRFGKDEKRPLP